MTPGEPDRSALRVLTLLAVRLRSRGTVDAVQATVDHLLGHAGTDIRPVIAGLINEGMLRSRGEAGRIALTVDGGELLEAELAEETDSTGRETITMIYRDFLVANREFLSVVSAWQTDSASSYEAVGVLVGLVERLHPLLDQLGERMPRFAGYNDRLTRAILEAETDSTWLDSPSTDSVHTIWFEIHEHLLATLGRSRTEER